MERFIPQEYREKKETQKSEFFIREATLEKTLEKLRAIEPSKRRIIVYAGVHPNEATDTLSEKFATAWAEKYGATVVCQPTEETPHAIWQKHKIATGADAGVALPATTVLNETDTVDQLALDNTTFVVRFHGTPLQYARDRKNPGLEVITSRYAGHPKEFTDRPRAGLFAHPHITDGLSSILENHDNNFENHVIEESRRDDPRFTENGPNTLLVEYFYKEQPVEISDPYIRELLVKESESEKAGGVFPLSPDNWQFQLKNGLEYLTQPTPTPEAIEEFNNGVVRDFEKILNYISTQLPK